MLLIHRPVRPDSAHHAAATLAQLAAIVRTRLRNIQRRPDLINALLGQADLTLDPQPP